jgi:beta-1,4-mannosyl-glycoprotein beta-1,4-N-acetylglucosaminyltransferase
MKNKTYFAEIGSWHGRSSRAIGDNLPDGSVLFCIDTFNGSEVEKESNHFSARLKDGDHAFYEFLQNNIDLIESSKIIPIRMSSKNAAALFKEKGILFDFIFIDGSHEYTDVCEDIDSWKDLLKEDGLFCGHDFLAWAGVVQAVQEKFSSFHVGVGTTIWYCGKHDIKLGKPAIFDVIPFNNEFEILERRFSELYDVVDRFVIVEATKTHGNKPKELNFHNNLKRFEKWLNKVTYIVVDDYSALDSWSIERHQRDAGMRGLTQCKDNDIIIISDCDEIPNVEAIKGYKPEDGIKSFDMTLYYYNENTKAADPWREAKILPYGILKQITPCGARYTHVDQAPIIPNGGKHLSYFGYGDIDRIIKKIQDTAHQEYNKPEFLDRERIKKSIEDGSDLFGRPLKFEKV